MKTENKNRIWSLVLSAILSIEQIAFAMPMISKADSSSSAHSNLEVDFPTIGSSEDIPAKLTHDDNLVDNGDGTFTFTSKITADYSFSDISMSRLKSTDGEYPLDKAGKYLIELWGGDGGDGSEFFPMSFKAGKGGAGGFVYGMLDVSTADAGTKKLVYEIGSKGESETRSITGGGTAGIGGGAGDVAIFSVGAGGGYSAVYLVDNGVTIGQDVPNVSNLRDDPSKVLMIAGGGGGGGAGASLHSLNFLSTIFGGEGKANGGDGGYAFRNSSNALETSGISATPSIGAFTSNNNNVGTYYAGENGSTSGTKSAYVGQGGTDRPGEIVKSFIGFIEASSYPNDWQRIFHSDAQRGIGGRGNFRGGGGGAGFAGGSGGLQNEPLEARNIGGGGGGSSYVAAGASAGGIDGFTPFADISAEQQSYFVAKDKNTNAKTGGAVVIRYLPTSADYSYLENVTIEGTISDYFDITGTYINSKSTGNTSGQIAVDADNKIRVSGSIAPKADGLEKGQANDALTISLKLKPKDGFAGGNNVPIFKSNTFKCFSKTNPEDNKCDIVYSSAAGENVTNVNVKYNVKFEPNNNLTKKENETYTEENLFVSGRTEYNSTDPMQAYISSISYEVDDFAYTGTKSFTVNAADVSNKKKTHKLTAKVTSKDATEAEVGSAGTGIINKTATVKCIAEGSTTVDGFTVKSAKNLSYDSDSGKYNFDVDLDVSLQDDKKLEAYAPVTTTVIVDVTNSYASGTTSTTSVELTPGIYYVEAWGGDGGNGGSKTGRLGDSGTGDGGKGGKGGFISGYITVDDNTTKNLSIILGAKGKPGSNNSYLSNVGNGQGGSPTKISIGGETVLMAGGGGGGSKPLKYEHGLVSFTDTKYHMGYYGLDGQRQYEDGETYTYAAGLFSDPSYNPNGTGSAGIDVDADYNNQFTEENADSDRIVKSSAFAVGGRSYISGDIKASLSDVIKSKTTINPQNVTVTDSDAITFVGKIGRGLVGAPFYVDCPGHFSNGNHSYTGGNWIVDNYYLEPKYLNTTKTGSNIKALQGRGAVKITKLGLKGYIKDVDGAETYTDDWSTTLSTKKLNAESTLAGYLSTNGFTIGETFSQFFDVDSVEQTPNSEAVSIVTEIVGDTNYQLQLNNASAKVSSTDSSSNTVPIAGYTVNKTTYTYSLANTKIGVRVKLKPKNGFLGGNDVPLLDKDANALYDSATELTSAVTVTHHNTTSNPDGDTKGIAPNVLTDYANIEIPEPNAQWKNNGTEYLPSEVIVPYGKKLSNVINPTITDPTNGKMWEADFVQWNETRTPGVNEPVTSEGYLTLTGSLNPKKSDPDAVVIPKVDGKSVTEKVKIRLKYNLTQTLTGFESSLPDTYEFTKDDITGDNLVVELTLKDGYDPKQNYVVSQSTDNEGNILYNVASNGVDENGNGKITITIPKSDITKNIKINAIAVSLDHNVKFMYQVYDGISISTQEADGLPYSNGDEIDASDPEFYPFNPTSDEYPYGYDAYDWDWPIEPKAGTTSKYTMGESDIYVVGTYRPKVYKLVVDYKAKNDEDKADFESKLPEKDRHYVSPDRTEYDEVNNLFRIALTKGTDYFVRSPEVSGYFPDKPLISGTVDDDEIKTYTNKNINGMDYKAREETVTYEKISANTNLIINFIECDAHGNPIRNGTAEQIAIDAGAYDENTPAIINKIDQYMASNTYEIYKRTKWSTKTTDDNPPTTYRIEEAVDAIEGTAAADVVETYYVYYIPKRVPVTVNFNAVDINADKPVAANVNISDTPRTVIKGREYGYDYVTDSYIGLPRAVCTGFVFEGWYTSDDKRIEDDTIVEGTGPINLYAHWRPSAVKITINYNYANNVSDTDKRGEKAAPSWVSGENGNPTLEYGMSYSVDSPDLGGYTPDKEVVKGVALQPETVPVFYTDTNNSSGTVKLRVDVYSSAYNNGNDQPTSTHKISRGTFILLDQNGNEIANSRIKNNNGTLEWTDVETKIAAGGKYTIMCIDPPVGYGVTEKSVTLDQETTQGSREYHFNFFLDKSPFQLPMAGSKPMTGYTVFGISAMLLAGLLMFAYVSSRTEENNEKE